VNAPALGALAAGALLLGLLGVLGAGAAHPGCAEIAPAPPVSLAPDPQAAIERLARAVRLRTVSPPDEVPRDPGPFRELHALLEQAFPRLHRELRRETLAELSLLYTWPGRDPRHPAVLLSAHLDVVPVEPDTEARWRQAPFGGAVVGGELWGRGSLDDKAAVMGALEAVELLVASGFRPARTIYLAFGHDEERGGREGAAAIAARLAAQGARLAYVLDEGLVIGDGLLPGVRPPVALVGVAEKGRLVLELTVRGTEGHASMPPPGGVVATLGRALARIERNPMPARVGPAMRALFACVAREMPLLQRVAVTNLWLFEPLVTRQLARAPVTNAGIRTTAALTVVGAGTKDNVLPGEGRAVVDLRILPGDSMAAVLEHVRRVVDDPAVRIGILGAPVEPSPLSPVDGPGFRAVAAAARRVFPEALVAPGLLVASTDSTHYLRLADAVYRFRPVRLTRADLARFHGIDERIAVEAYLRLVAFYVHLLRHAGEAPEPAG
jgi:carboxypeptidase PM20D1